MYYAYLPNVNVFVDVWVSECEWMYIWVSMSVHMCAYVNMTLSEWLLSVCICGCLSVGECLSVQEFECECAYLCAWVFCVSCIKACACVLACMCVCLCVSVFVSVCVTDNETQLHYCSFHTLSIALLPSSSPNPAQPQAQPSPTQAQPSPAQPCPRALLKADIGSDTEM